MADVVIPMGTNNFYGYVKTVMSHGVLAKILERRYGLPIGRFRVDFVPKGGKELENLLISNASQDIFGRYGEISDFPLSWIESSKDLFFPYENGEFALGRVPFLRKRLGKLFHDLSTYFNQESLEVNLKDALDGTRFRVRMKDKEVSIGISSKSIFRLVK